jgi:hypothetical protein
MVSKSNINVIVTFIVDREEIYEGGWKWLLAIRLSFPYLSLV